MKTRITKARLCEVLHYDQTTGLFTWITKTAVCIKVGDVAGGLDDKGYLRLKIDGRQYRLHQLAWLWMTGEWCTYIDHFDTVKTNNKWGNLRRATHSQNHANRRIGVTNTSGYKGVSWNKNKGKWAAQIMVNRKGIYLGYFNAAKDAHAAYCKAAKYYFGDFARAA